MTLFYRGYQTKHAEIGLQAELYLFQRIPTFLRFAVKVCFVITKLCRCVHHSLSEESDSFGFLHKQRSSGAVVLLCKRKGHIFEVIAHKSAQTVLNQMACVCVCMRR